MEFTENIQTNLSAMSSLIGEDNTGHLFTNKYLGWAYSNRCQINCKRIQHIGRKTY